MTFSDEEAFLARIADEPENETNRLVFADWLDEHGEGEKAEFLRLEVQLRVGTKRLEALSPTLDPEWVSRAAGHEWLIIYGYKPGHKINVIKTIREVTGLGLAESKSLSESLPARIRHGSIHDPKWRKVRQQLREAGAFLNPPQSNPS